MKFKKLSSKEYSLLSHKYEHFRSIFGNQFELSDCNCFIKYRFIVFENFVVIRLTVFSSPLKFKVFFLKYNKSACQSSQRILYSIFDFASNISLDC